jgi:HPt (histidine-containing phosphotransfer) domain-containing protein
MVRRSGCWFADKNRLQPALAAREHPVVHGCRDAHEQDGGNQAEGAENAARFAHALKSMSHNIGARQVAAAAEAIERHARETGMPAAEQMETLGGLLEATMASVRSRIGSQAHGEAVGRRSAAAAS